MAGSTGRFGGPVWGAGDCGIRSVDALNPPRRRPLARTQPSPSPSSRGLALSPSLFRRESQSTIHDEAGGVTEPFRCLGFVRYESHEGERAIPAGWMQGMGLAV